MKKGRKYIEPVLGKGDKKGTNIPDKRRNEAASEIKNMQTKDMKKATPKVGANGKTWDGLEFLISIVLQFFFVISNGFHTNFI